jgi:hypothetical protein
MDIAFGISNPESIFSRKDDWTMQNISWNLFSVTGNIDAYLLYKDYQRMNDQEEERLELSIHSEEREG